jgi:hypothetical protein
MKPEIRYYNIEDKIVGAKELVPDQTYTLYYKDGNIQGIILTGTPEELSEELPKAKEYATYMSLFHSVQKQVLGGEQN